MNSAEFLEIWRSGVSGIPVRSSGSTGVPKDFLLPRSMMVNSAWRTIGFFGLHPGSRLHSCVDFRYIGGKMMAVRAEELRCRLTSEPPSLHPLESLYGRSDIVFDMMAVVPAQLPWLIENRNMLPQVGVYLCGGAPVSDELSEQVRFSGLTVWETYGMTETASHVALRRVGEDTLFTPLSGITLSEDGRGCLVIRLESDGVEVRTNDMVEFSGDGSFRILGRHDNVIVTGGKKVHPEEVEKKIGRWVYGADMVVSSRPDPIWGEKVVLVTGKGEIRLSESGVPVDGEELLSFFHSRLTADERPRELIRIPEIPVTPNGKVARAALKGLLSEL